MKYTAPFDIWQVPYDLLKHVQPGQYVYAGDRSNPGRFMGVKSRSGVVVVAWHGNVRNQKRGERAEYLKTLRNYARG